MPCTQSWALSSDALRFLYERLNISQVFQCKVANQLTIVSGTSSPRSMISLISGRSWNSDDIVTALDRPLVSRMNGVLTPLPEPGAPFSQTTSFGV